MPTDPIPFHGRACTFLHPETGEERTFRARLTDEESQRMADAIHAHGYNIKVAAESLGVSRRSLHRYADRMGLIEVAAGIKRRTKTTYTHANGRSIETLYPWGAVHKAITIYEREKLSTRDVEARTGLPFDTIHDWTQRLRITRRPNAQCRITRARRRGADPYDLDSECRRLTREHGATQEEVARRLGVSRRFVSDALRRGSGGRRRQTTIAKQAAETCRRRGNPTGRSSDPDAIAARAAEAKRLRAEDVHPYRIAERLGVSVATVYHDFKRAA